MSRGVSYGAEPMDDPPIVRGKDLTPARSQMQQRTINPNAHAVARQRSEADVPTVTAALQSTIPHAVPADVPVPAGESSRIGRGLAFGANNIQDTTGGYNPFMVLGGAALACWVISQVASKHQ